MTTKRFARVTSSTPSRWTYGPEGRSRHSCASSANSLVGQRGSGTDQLHADTEADVKVIRSKEDNREYVQDETGDYIERTAQWYVKVYDPDTGATTNAMIAMKSTQLKKSKKWMSMIMSRELKGPNGPFTPAMYSHIYKLTSQSEENSKGKWHGWEISLHGQVPDAGVYNSAKAFHTSVEA